MSRKSLIFILMFAGSWVGSYVPVLWGASSFSVASVIFSTIGGAAGIWLGFRMGE